MTVGIIYCIPERLRSRPRFWERERPRGRFAGHAVGDQDFHLAGVVLGEEGIQAAFDGGTLRSRYGWGE